MPRTSGHVAALTRTRLALTALYALAGVLLIAVVGGGVYRVLDTYFERTTDQALRYMMAGEFRSLGATIPTDLQSADEWPVGKGSDAHSARDKTALDASKEPRPAGSKAKADADLAAVFAMPLDEDLQLLVGEAPEGLPIGPNLGAARAALSAGSDWRTMEMAGGERVRLFSHRVEGHREVAVLQLGRTLNDQDRVLQQVLAGVVQLGVVALVIIGALAWWLAGISIRPAKLAWEQQQQFVANASHELRTPLSLISATAEVARRGLDEGAAEQREMMDDIVAESRHMGRLVADLLLLSRLDTDDLPLEPKSIPVAELVGDVARQSQRLLADRSIGVEVGEAAGAVWADPVRIRQVLLALVDNSIRHTADHGSIRVSGTPLGGQIQLTVEDNGSGIASEHLERVFDRFYRVDPARGSGENSGLGLAIARELIEHQGGTISVWSQADVGTRVSILLPASREHWAS